MPNILLTTRCNLSCPYCFAQEKMYAHRMDMPLENVQRVIDFLKRSKFPLFRVMGGEPTLHPNFNEIIQMALDEGFHVDVLSNATWSESTAAFFSRISSKKLGFLLNIDHPDRYTAKQRALIQRNLNSLKGRGGITLSFNIFEKQPRSDYILELAQQYEIKDIRLSLSLPVFGTENAYLPFKELFEIAPFVPHFAAEAEARGIAVRFDNAVPLCIFDEAQLSYLLLHGVYDLNNNPRCDPIIDIGPDLTIWSCFCLSALENRQLGEFATLFEAQAYYRRVWGVYQDKVFPLGKCASCFYREKWGCQGGCLTYAVLQDSGQRFMEQSSGTFKDFITPETVFRLEEGVKVFKYDIPTPTFILRKSSDNLDIEIDPAFQAILPLLDGRHTLQEISAVLRAPDASSSTLNVFLEEVFTESLAKFLIGLMWQGFLVTEKVDLSPSL